MIGDKINKYLKHLYHYTDQTGAAEILRCGYLRPSPRTNLFDEGIYLTGLAPNLYTRQEILYNNYGSQWYDYDGRADYVVVINWDDLDPWLLRRCRLAVRSRNFLCYRHVRVRVDNKQVIRYEDYTVDGCNGDIGDNGGTGGTGDTGGTGGTGGTGSTGSTGGSGAAGGTGGSGQTVCPEIITIID
ncbi:uncharacterized protein LOC128956015 [Oppia nitens]|uniref:uncharacterized protein LOC128956015 n=1 Tax=Oppia nitens TaxID=1686743 RepID=UPI0023DC57EF|nr:uncharacterized protein LOC128956015 [Oppia nitens]